MQIMFNEIDYDNYIKMSFLNETQFFSSTFVYRNMENAKRI